MTEAPPLAEQSENRTKLLRVDDDKDVAEALALMTAPIIAVDTETTGLDPLTDRLLLTQLSDGKTNVVFNMTRIENWSPIRRWLSSDERLHLAHNAKFDYGWLAWKLTDRDGPAWDIMPRLFDTSLAEALITSGLGLRVNLKETANRYLKLKLDKTEQTSFIGMTEPRPTFTDSQLVYAAKDVEILPSIFTLQAKQLARLKMIDIAGVEFKLLKVIARMELRGVLIDTVEWQRVVEDSKVLCGELEQRMRDLTGEEKFNSRSPKQVSDAFRKVGYVLASTNAKTLSKIDHPLAKALLEYRKAVVIRDRYGDNWLARLGVDNRIHAQFRQIGAATGRFSSANPNLQQLPRGDLLRKAFVAGPGRKMITADYSQIELRILAELSQDTNMIDMFAKGYDIHQGTAAQMFKRKMEDVTPELRQMAKSVSFGLVYGAGPDNLRGQLSDQGVQVSRPEAEGLIRQYFEVFPRAKQWLDRQSKRSYNCIDEGIEVVTTTMGGRIRRFPVNPGMSGFERGHVARQSRNTPIQGTSADITKVAMVLLDEDFMAHPEWDAHLLMTVHDELIAECKAEYAEVVLKSVQDNMVKGAQKYMSLCPVKADGKISDYWAK